MQEDGYFGARIAATYDDEMARLFLPETVDPVVDFLVPLVGPGKALEFGIGTGRIALPLAKRGSTVHGIELSRAMASRLAAKPGASSIPVTIGDFSVTSTGASYSLVFLLFNTIMNLTTQEAQVACFRNAAAHLEAGGHFVVEVMIPRLDLVSRTERRHVFEFAEGKLGIDEYEFSTQSLISHHIKLSEDRMEKYSIPCRYVWPSELDLMAQLAGMSLIERVASWGRDPFSSESLSHISVWRKVGE